MIQWTVNTTEWHTPEQPGLFPVLQFAVIMGIILFAYGRFLRLREKGEL